METGNSRNYPADFSKEVFIFVMHVEQAINFHGRQSTICIFSFKVWKVFLLVRGRREPSKPRFGALPTSRTKRSDNCRKSVYFFEMFRKCQEQLEKFCKKGEYMGNIGAGQIRTGTPVFEIQVLSTLVQKYRRAQKKNGSSKLRWERFMRFMERYADVSGLAFERAPPAPDGSRNFRLAQEFGIVE